MRGAVGSELAKCVGGCVGCVWLVWRGVCGFGKLGCQANEVVSGKWWCVAV